MIFQFLLSSRKRYSHSLDKVLSVSLTLPVRGCRRRMLCQKTWRDWQGNQTPNHVYTILLFLWWKKYSNSPEGTNEGGKLVFCIISLQIYYCNSQLSLLAHFFSSRKSVNGEKAEEYIWLSKKTRKLHLSSYSTPPSLMMIIRAKLKFSRLISFKWKNPHYYSCESKDMPDSFFSDEMPFPSSISIHVFPCLTLNVFPQLNYQSDSGKQLRNSFVVVDTSKKGFFVSDVRCTEKSFRGTSLSHTITLRTWRILSS